MTWRQLYMFKLNSKHVVCLRGENVRSLASWKHVAHQLAWLMSNGFRLRNGPKYMSIWSIKRKKNEMKRKEKLLCGSLQVGKRNVDSFPAEGASGETAQPFPPPSTQPFTSGSYRAIEHSPSTSTSPTSATKSILKQHSPQFPHYFTCQTLTKHLWMAKYSYGAPQHTSCQPRPY